MSHGIGPVSWALPSILQTCEHLPRPRKGHPIGLFFALSIIVASAEEFLGHTLGGATGDSGTAPCIIT